LPGHRDSQPLFGCDQVVEVFGGLVSSPMLRTRLPPNSRAWSSTPTSRMTTPELRSA